MQALHGALEAVARARDLRVAKGIVRDYAESLVPARDDRRFVPRERPQGLATQALPTVAAADDPTKLSAEERAEILAGLSDFLLPEVEELESDVLEELHSSRPPPRAAGTVRASTPPRIPPPPPAPSAPPPQAEMRSPGRLEPDEGAGAGIEAESKPRPPLDLAGEHD